MLWSGTRSLCASIRTPGYIRCLTCRLRVKKGVSGTVLGMLFSSLFHLPMLLTRANENPRTGSRKQRKTGAEKLWSIILTLGRESLLHSIRVLSFFYSLSSPPLTKFLTYVAFYLIINLSAGGTSGWFPDNVGGKPWIDASLCTYLRSPLFPSCVDFCWAQSSCDARLCAGAGYVVCYVAQ